MKITYNEFEEVFNELGKMFNKAGDSVEYIKNKVLNTALVTVITENMILETQKGEKYLYGAILKCDNFSIQARGNQLIIKFGFQY